MKTLLVLVLLFGVWSTPVLTLAASADPAGGLSAAQRDRYYDLTQQFRCVVCQNRSIADSDAPLAGDLRGLVARQIAAGKSNTQIKTYLVSRYGDWILYNPPFQWSTLLLWLGPFVLLAFGLWLIAVLVMRRTAARQEETALTTSAMERARIQALLDEADHDSRTR